MTRLREPATFENALAKIAVLLGYDGCATVLGKSESHVRKLGAPDTEREISLRDAVRLDAAWRRAGGEGAPLLECYALKLDLGTTDTPIAGASLMMAGAAKAAKESGEAVAAALVLASDTRDPKKRLDAVREIEESIAAQSHLLTQIVAGREADVA